jgi:hypothetical protein
MPQEGHLYAVLHIFAYLKQYLRLKIVVDADKLIGPHGIFKRVTGKSSIWVQKKLSC